ncbi:PulJ/GspJ family protein [Pseudomonas oryzae]|uniref:MSHA biogenesis protein MshO n=1 Tax=Pseudomonas oryzae TaxID=1392877 RepID=A0A1H1WHD1_9PSED|nr:prepilin-type N-terminal cleavage/methylation domain-containing protein [Pseudomonas oryzae]SDS96452.1 MSHA biogenesis protein MshO [Pseudomonas oryzae]
MTERRRLYGFTLVELVLVIALSAVVAVMIGSVLSHPLTSFVDQSRRAELVDRGALALSRMQRDIRLAVPNSLRVSADGQALELLNIHGAGRYRPNRSGSDALAFASGTAATCTATGQRCDAFQLLESGLDPSGARWLVLYNVGAESAGVPLAGSNLWAYANPGVVTPSGTSFTALSGAPAGESLLQVSTPGDFRFAYASPQRRVYLADKVVGYRCVGGELRRYEYSQLLATLPASIPSGANSAAVAGDVAACGFAYRRGIGSRAGLASLRLRLSLGGESVELTEQVHIDNAP